MKPLATQKSIDALMDRVENAKDAQSLSINIINATCMKIHLTLQDKNRDYDWIGLNFEIEGIRDARLLDENKLAHVDTSEGITVIKTATSSALAIGKFAKSETSLSDAVVYIIGDSIKYEECEPIL